MNKFDADFEHNIFLDFFKKHLKKILGGASLTSILRIGLGLILGGQI